MYSAETQAACLLFHESKSGSWGKINTQRLGAWQVKATPQPYISQDDCWPAQSPARLSQPCRYASIFKRRWPRLSDKNIYCWAVFNPMQVWKETFSYFTSFFLSNVHTWCVHSTFVCMSATMCTYKCMSTWNNRGNWFCSSLFILSTSWLFYRTLHIWKYDIYCLDQRGGASYTAHHQHRPNTTRCEYIIFLGVLSLSDKGIEKQQQAKLKGFCPLKK